MNDIEKRARELLAAEFRRQGYEDAAYAAENAIVGGYMGAIISAIIAALSAAPQVAGGSMDRLDASIDESMLAAKRDEKA